MLSLCNYLDEHCPELFYFVPEYYITAAFTIIKVFLRLQVHRLSFIWPTTNVLTYPSDELLAACLTFLARHFNDKSIPNPSQQEMFQGRLKLLLQCKEIVGKMELHPVARTIMLRGLLNSFEHKPPKTSVTNLLRLIKKDTFNDIPRSVLPEAASEYFRKQFTELCITEVGLRESYLNGLFGYIGTAIFEIKVQIAESTNPDLDAQAKHNHASKVRSLYSSLYNALRLLEATVGLIPAIFLDGSKLVTQRASDLCMLVAREGTESVIHQYLGELSSKNRIPVFHIVV